jgi:peptidyl-tRNA hydrolase, PTH2 family
LKQVIVVNEALGLPCGKLAAQVAHAAIGAFLEAEGNVQSEWLSSGMKKVVLACESESALKALHDLAQQAGLPVFLVADAGRTVVASGTVTCLGIGPAPVRLIAQVAGTLRLLR